MTKNLKYPVIWLVTLLSLYFSFFIAAYFYNKEIKLIQNELFGAYKQVMSLPLAHKRRFDAYTYYENKERLKSELGSAGFLGLADISCERSQIVRRYQSFFFISYLVAAGIGVVWLALLLILSLIGSFKARRVDSSYNKPLLVLFLGVGLSFCISSYQSFMDGKQIKNDANQVYDIAQPSSRILYHFIDLSNSFYEISILEDKGPRNVRLWSDKMALARKTNENFLKELKSAKKWPIPKNNYYLPSYENIILPAIYICEHLDKYFEHSLTSSPHPAERQISNAENSIEFSDILEKLASTVKWSVDNSNDDMRYIFLPAPLGRFHAEALAKFESMSVESKEAKFKRELLFGYTVYSVAWRRAINEAAHEQREKLAGTVGKNNLPN